MEHYSELIKLRKKHGCFDNNEKKTDPKYGVDLAIAHYPAAMVAYLFEKELSERDKNWLAYENMVLINRGVTPVPHSVVLGLKNYVFLLEKDRTINQLLAELYKFEAYSPFTCLMPIDSLPDNVRPAVKKAFLTLIKIEKSLQVFAIGVYKDKGFSYCRYDAINKNVAKVFIENNCSILFSNFKNRVCLYFDPMSFSDEDLFDIAKKLENKLNITAKVVTNYDNYSITFVKNCTSIEVFNIINENPNLRIGTAKTQSKIKINKPIVQHNVEEPKESNNLNIPKSSFSNKFKK